MKDRKRAMPYHINWEIDTPHADAAGMLLHVNEKFTFWGKGMV